MHGAHVNVDVAICIAPSLPVASAVMVAFPAAAPVAIPAVAPNIPPLWLGSLEFTVITFGAEEIHRREVEFVRSLIAGGVENVPMARNCPVSFKLATLIDAGIIVSDKRLPAASAPVTVMAALALTGPLNAVAFAVIVVVPAPTAVTNPEELTVATVGTLELQLTPLVKSCVDGWLALP